MTSIATICFYCKKLVIGEDLLCPHCKRRRRLIKVRYTKTKVNKWWQRTRYEYKVLDRKYKFIEPQLAEARL